MHALFKVLQLATMFNTPTLSFSCPTCRGGFEGSDKELSGGKTNSSAPMSTELYGGLTGGRPWDDGINDGVREITLVYGKCIDSITLAYDQDGQLVKAGKHGGLGGSDHHKPYPISTVKVSFQIKLILKIKIMSNRSKKIKF